MSQLTAGIEEEGSGLENPPEGASKSLREAINRYCRLCGYDSLDKGAGNWRQQIQACPVIACELYEVRPISKPKKSAELPFTP